MKHREKSSSIHEELCKRMQEASELYVREHYQPPELDKELMERLIQAARRQRYKRIVRVATMFMVLLMGSMSMGVWMNADGVYGGKRVTQKVIRFFEPLEIQEKIDEEGNITQELKIDKFENVPDALDFFDKIYVPEFVPAEYQFKQLVIEKRTEFVQYEYTYEDKNETPLYICFIFQLVQMDTMISGDTYRSPRTGEELHINEIEETDEFTVTRATDEYDCIVSGYGSKNVGIRIMENLRKL